jgi:hypothetical protein
MKHLRLSRNYRIISVMFWAFPYLLWQAFGHWSGFVVGILVALILTVLLNNLISTRNEPEITVARRQELHQAEPQLQQQEMEPYQRGYRGEEEIYQTEPQPYLEGALQPQYEEMQVPYPQEVMSPMEQKRAQGR